MSSHQTVTRRCYRRSSQSEPHLELITNETIGITSPTEVLIKVHTVSLNFRDANILYGQNPWPVIDKHVPCNDAVGEVVDIGSDVKEFKVGDRVTPIIDLASITGREQERCWLAADVDGVLADYLVFNKDHVVKVPENLGWKEASLLPCAGLTAWDALKGAKIGDTVVIQGTGGVSLMALKLARAAGLKVILTSSSDEKLERLKNRFEHPPLITVNYAKNPDWHEEVRKLNGGKAVDLVLENGGTSSVVKSLKVVKRGGTVSQIGYLGKQDPADLKELLPTLIDRRVNLRGINAGSKHDLEDLFEAVAATQLHFQDTIDAVFAFEDAQKAIEYVWKGRQVGKVVIEI